MSAARTPSKAAAAHVVPHLRLNRYIIHKPTPLQAAFLLLSAIEAFFGGAAGPGKSEALLMAALQYVDEPGYAALIVRETFVQLSQPGGLMFRANEWLAGTDAVWNAAHHTWRFPSGRRSRSAHSPTPVHSGISRVRSISSSVSMRSPRSPRGSTSSCSRACAGA